MAETWLPEILKFHPVAPLPRRSPVSWMEYWRGISFALPLLCSCLAILLFDFSLWGGPLSAEEATAVGLGTVASFLTSGGFVQAMSRRSLFFIGTNQPRRCEMSTWAWVRRGAFCNLAVVAGALVVSTLSGWLPARINVIAGAFSAALSLFWLAMGILCFLKRGILGVWVTLGGIAIVAVLHRGLRLPLLASQFAAISMCAAVSFVLSHRLLRRTSQTPAPDPPVSSLLQDACLLWPYFGYGVLYYLLLFGDRLISWTADTYASALIVQFRGDYETALNVGLLAFVVQVGWVHRSTVAFYHRVNDSLARYFIHQTTQFRKAMLDFYRDSLAGFIPLAAAASILSMLCAVSSGIVHGRAMAVTTLWSLAGFPFLVAGLWNVSLLFGLSGALQAVRAVGIACLVDLCVGYILSRVGAYPYAVVGFTAGAVVFALLSGIDTLRAFRRLDYCYFAAST